VRAQNLGKQFQWIHEKPMLLREALLFVAGRSRRYEDFWALRNISFEVRRGQVLGLIGRNGSGKSTLLELVAGSSFPNEGSVSTQGRVSMLLSFAGGLNPNMTGEENILLSAGVMGLSPEEVKRRLPQIVEFAELQSVIDTPVRHYSSGMTARLGFSLAINVSADIVVIDEILGVGDIPFQRKCHEEMLRLKAKGTTIVYATQAPMQLAEFCTHALWLHEGVIRSSGTARQIASEYSQFADANSSAGAAGG
jgi:ABC-type polysaccharide/polyol phosphate transport system ATPase subunit